MLDYTPRDPCQLVRLPSEYLLVCAQEPDQGLLLLGFEVGAYGESGVGGSVLIDGGTGLSVFSVEAFNLLRIPRERLQPSRPFSGVGGGSSSSLGQIRLPVTFDTYDNFRTELVDFDIALIGLPYNAILGYPALA